MMNIEKIRETISWQEFGAIILTNPVNRLFATGFMSSDGALLMTGDEAWFFTDSRYIEAAGTSVTGADVRLVTGDDPYHAQIKAILQEKGITSVGFEADSVTYAGYLEWTEKLEAKMIPANKLISGLRAVKTPGDLKKLKEAQRVSEKAFEEILPLISARITEKQLSAELVYRMMTNGADDKAFDPIIVSGPRSSMPHGVPGDNYITNGFLTIDFGARLDNWCSDTTRTVCVGEPDDEMVKVYDTVLEAQEAGIRAARAGIAGSEVDAAARSVIENAGYGEFFGHGFGHGLGLEVHEAPVAKKTSEDTLQEGAVISAEPGIYIPGRFGVRIEDVIYITKDGCENITNLPKKLIIV